MIKKSRVRIRLNHPLKNKAEGFYLLMVNGDTYSDTENEFVVEHKALKILSDNNIQFDQLPLSGE